ncbi:HEAT repeat domain-containing protein [Pseudomonas turukhanskensis]|uniref:PBS lyase n=1 Tax=Pseudomonas turukhanskensis TaxID=1806536 RepID=A0A9W6K2K7_9PSED|nr:HEAT repeat domain-containing protein [Pseudomonas turukhanskensis]GLK87632.1 hypothetical protein GCM10017655_06940 [Pseudomonas turukhanskensis]
MVFDRLRALYQTHRAKTEVAGWLRQLGSADPRVRERAVRELGELRDERLREPLLNACDDPDADVRGWALTYLSEITDDQLPRFLAAASDPAAFVRQQACNALRYSSPEAIAVLLKALRDEAAPVRLEAVLALGSLDATEAIEAIGQLQQSDPDEDVRDYATSTLEGFAERRTSRAYDWTPTPIEPPNIPALLAALGSPDTAVRVQACIGLQAVAVAEAVEELNACLQDPDEELRAHAALALAASADPRGYEPLRERLNNEPAAYVRRRLVWALSFYPAEQCIPLLTQCLADREEAVRQTAVLALAQLCELHELEMLLQHLPKRVPADVIQALAEAVEEWDEDEKMPAASQRSIRLGTVQYE